MKKYLFTIVVAFMMQHYGLAQSSFDPTWAGRFQEVLDSVVAAEGIMGASAAVLATGEGIWSGISGNSMPGVPLTSEMRFGIGSNTKLFTAVTLVKLQEENVLSLDDHLYQWLPSYQHIDSSITIRQLLSHQSGIYSFTDNNDFWNAVQADTAHFWTSQEILGYVGAPQFEPGTAWRYSNTNYILAGMIIEAATGKTWVQKLHEIIFDPLDMDSTFVGAYEPANGPIAAYKWGSGSGPWFSYPVTSHFSSAGSAGAIVSTAKEMVQWYHALIGGEILSDSSLQQILDFEPASHYGLGIVGDADRSLKYSWYDHGGQIFNHCSQIIFDIKTQSLLCIIKTNYPSDIGTLVPFVDPMISVLHNEYPKKENDAGITNILTPQEHLCTDLVTPQVTLKNFGTDPLTTVNVNYSLDNGTPIPYQWTGNLVTGDTILVSLTSASTGEGLHTLSVFSSEPNNSPDGYMYNDTIVIDFIKTLTSPVTFPYAENFEDLLFPPEGWISSPIILSNWGRTSLTSYSGNSCAVKCNTWDMNHSGAKYNLDLPMIQLTTANNPTLSFTYAYSCSYGYPRDTLTVAVSTDCGSTWQTVFYKGGIDLKTAPITANPFFPKQDQWRNENILLGNYSGNVIIRFQNTSGSSNNLFLDDISVGWAVGIDESQVYTNLIQIYPNPASTTIDIKSPIIGTLSILDLGGQQLLQQQIIEPTTTIDVSILPNGVYVIKVLGEKGVQVGKLIKQ